MAGLDSREVVYTRAPAELPDECVVVFFAASGVEPGDRLAARITSSMLVEHTRYSAGFMASAASLGEAWIDVDQGGKTCAAQSCKVRARVGTEGGDRWENGVWGGVLACTRSPRAYPGSAGLMLFRNRM